jgi:hypothetical protein
MQWEYKIINSKIKSKGFISSEPDDHSFEVNLNDLGKQNWELVSCNLPQIEGLGHHHIQAILKRPR